MRTAGTFSLFGTCGAEGEWGRAHLAAASAAVLRLVETKAPLAIDRRLLGGLSTTGAGLAAPPLAQSRTNGLRKRPMLPVSRSGASVTARQMQMSSSSAIGLWSRSPCTSATSPGP